jgi:tryptophan-rich sensory protein
MADKISGGRAWIGLLGWVGLSLATGLVASVARPGEWYRSLEKPPWNPPDAVFAPVWSALYVAMGVAAWLVWREARPESRRALVLFGLQLLFNALWMWLFFRWQLPGVALVEIVVLWALIAATIAAFYPVSRVAAVLLVPYLLWVSFATLLNLELWRLNP